MRSLLYYKEQGLSMEEKWCKVMMATPRLLHVLSLHIDSEAGKPRHNFAAHVGSWVEGGILGRASGPPHVPPISLMLDLPSAERQRQVVFKRWWGRLEIRCDTETL